MICELLYTSAPETLDGPGYGAVGKSSQFPGAVEKFIRQQLNQYDFSRNDSTADTPARSAVFSHALFKEGTKVWHVLSRVGFGGYDYTQRAVFLAHHLALNSDELTGISAARLMLSPALFVTQWNGRVETLPPRVLPNQDARGPRLDHWQSLAGDAHWATVWADGWLRQKDLPHFMIVPNNATALPLFAEAISLLPADIASEVSFLTSLSSERSGVRFDWIGLPAEGEMANSMLKQFPDRVFDLSRPRGPAPAKPAGRLRVMPPVTATPLVPKAEVVKAGITSRAPGKLATPAGVSAATSRTSGDLRPPLGSLEPWEKMMQDEAAAAREANRQASDEGAPPPPPPPSTWGAARIAWIAVAALIFIGVGTALGGWLLTGAWWSGN